jgi:hypothetical protein
VAVIVRLASGRQVEVEVRVGRPAKLHGHPDTWCFDEGIEVEVLTDGLSDTEASEATELALAEVGPWGGSWRILAVDG